MKKNKYLKITVPIIILSLLGMIFHSQYTNNPRFWYCSPSEPRGDDLQTWKKTINPELPVSQIDEEFFNQFTISSDQEKFTIDYPDKKRQENPFAFELRELSPGENLEIGSGILEFPIIGIVFPDINQSLEEGIDFRFYDTQLQLMSKEHVIELEKRVRELQYSVFIRTGKGYPNPLNLLPNPFNLLPSPRVIFIFEPHGIENIIFNNFAVFDSRTHKPLAGGGINSGELPLFTTDIRLWHSTPIDVVLDVSFGPTITYEFSPVEGEGFAAENFECRLLNVFEGINPSWTDGDKKLLRAPVGEACQKFYFICQPQALYMPVSFEFFDKEGNKLTARGTCTSAYTYIVNLKEPLEKVALVRANYRPKGHRIVLHLPNIPGLPEQNINIDNLFDVYIPYVKFDNLRYLQQFLTQALQLSHFTTTGPTPVKSIESMQFPIEFSDVTVRDIAEIYASGGNLNVDIENDSLELKYPLPLLTRLKQYWDKIFRK